MGLSTHLRAREELAWYFTSLGPTVGLRAAGLEAGGGIYDAYASARDHMRHFDPSHRANLRKAEAVRSSLGRVEQPTRQVLAQAFTPFGAARASWRLTTAMAREGVCLVGVALRSDSLAQVWGQLAGKGADGPPTPFMLLLFLEDQVARLRRGNRVPTSHKLHRVLDECADVVGAALGSYAAVRGDVGREQAAEKRESRARMLAAVQAKLAGA